MSQDTFQMTPRRAVTRIVTPEEKNPEKVQEKLEVQEEPQIHEDYEESNFSSIEEIDNVANETLPGGSGD